MLYWRPTPDDNRMASATTMTLFSISKSVYTDRLISWPRFLNQHAPDPPHCELPDPSSFNAILASSPKLSAFFFDVSNMFHQIILPRQFADLLSLPAVVIEKLDVDLQIFVLEDLRKRYPNCRFRLTDRVQPSKFDPVQDLSYCYISSNSIGNTQIWISLISANIQVA